MKHKLMLKMQHLLVHSNASAFEALDKHWFPWQHDKQIMSLIKRHFVTRQRSFSWQDVKFLTSSHEWKLTLFSGVLSASCCGSCVCDFSWLLPVGPPVDEKIKTSEPVFSAVVLFLIRAAIFVLIWLSSKSFFMYLFDEKSFEIVEMRHKHPLLWLDGCLLM